MGEGLASLKKGPSIRAIALIQLKFSVYFILRSYFFYFTPSLFQNTNFRLFILKIYFNVKLIFHHFLLLIQPFLSTSLTATTLAIATTTTTTNTRHTTAFATIITITTTRCITS